MHTNMNLHANVHTVGNVHSNGTMRQKNRFVSTMSNAGDNFSNLATSTIKGIKHGTEAIRHDAQNLYSDNNSIDLSNALSSNDPVNHIKKMNRFRYLVLIAGLVITFILAIVGIILGFSDHYSCYRRTQDYTNTIINNITYVSTNNYRTDVFCEVNSTYFVIAINNNITTSNGNNMSCYSSQHALETTHAPTIDPQANLVNKLTNFAEICGNKSSTMLLIISINLLIFIVYVFSVVGELRLRQQNDEKRAHVVKEDEHRIVI